MTIEEYKNKLAAGEVVFEDTMAVVEANYNFSPTKFANGKTTNDAGQNSGSCKLFAFAKTQGLSEEETLKAFGQYYQEVLDTPEGDSHQNIRNFIIYGWQGIKFESEALVAK